MCHYLFFSVCPLLAMVQHPVQWLPSKTYKFILKYFRTQWFWTNLGHGFLWKSGANCRPSSQKSAQTNTHSILHTVSGFMSPFEACLWTYFIGLFSVEKRDFFLMGEREGRSFWERLFLRRHSVSMWWALLTGGRHLAWGEEALWQAGRQGASLPTPCPGQGRATTRWNWRQSRQSS